MQPSLEPIRALAAQAAQLDLVLTAELVGRALNLPSDDARDALLSGATAGFFRARKLPGLGNRLVFQPTVKAAGLPPAGGPLSLRKSAPPGTLWRGLIRASVRFDRPNLSFLPRAETAEFSLRYGVQTRGAAPALICLDGAHFHVFQPVLPRPGQSPAVVLEAVISRYFLALESGSLTLHFAALAGAPADSVQAALRELAPDTSADAMRAELAEVEASIRADQTGNTFALTARRATLQRELAAAQVDQDDGADDLYRWLDRTVIQVTV
jgi:hypothetical protein